MELVHMYPTKYVLSLSFPVFSAQQNQILAFFIIILMKTHTFKTSLFINHLFNFLQILREILPQMQTTYDTMKKIYTDIIYI